MEMGSKELVRILPQRADNLAAPDLLPGLDLDFIQVGIGGANCLSFIVLVEDVIDHHDIAPQPATELRERHAAMRDGMDVLTQIGVRRTEAAPVLAGVNSVFVDVREVR